MTNSCIIFMDCHGNEIYKNLYDNINFINDFNVKIISLNNYVVRDSCKFNNTKLADEDIIIIKNADILILQVIESDRGFLNNNEVIKFCKSKCKVIKIPHYRNSIYQYKCIENKINKYDLINNFGDFQSKIKDINNIDETKEIIQNEIDIMNNFPYDKVEMLKIIKFKINEFNQIDDLSDIKMLDYYNKNYKKYMLFMGRSYPSSRFFYELTNRLLITLNYNPNNKFIDTNFAQNTSEPIPDYWYKFCNFSFDNIFYIYGNIPITEYEWYYILLLSKNINICDKEENLNFLKIIRKSTF